METSTVLLAMCETSDAEHWSFFALRVKKRLSKQSTCRWFRRHGDHYDVTVKPIVDVIVIQVHFTNDFIIVIHIRWKVHSALIQAVMKWLIWIVCTLQDNLTVVAYTELCIVMILVSGVTLKTIFQRIWIMMKKMFVKWVVILMPNFNGVQIHKFTTEVRAWACNHIPY